MELAVAADVAIDLATKDDLDQHHKNIAKIFEKPRGRYYPISGSTVTTSGFSGSGPIALSFTPQAPPPGRQWLLQWLTMWVGTNVVVPPVGQTPASTALTSAAATGSASAIAPTFGGAAGTTAWITAFQITGLGATGGSTINATLTGVQGGTQTYPVVIPAGATVAITPVTASFGGGLQASAAAQAITLNVPSFGAGNTNSQASLEGFIVTPASGGALNAALCIGNCPTGPGGPSSRAVAINDSDIVLPGLAIPVGVTLPDKMIVRSQTELYILIGGAGLAASTVYNATAGVIDVPDTDEALFW